LKTWGLVGLFLYIDHQNKTPVTGVNGFSRFQISTRVTAPAVTLF